MADSPDEETKIRMPGLGRKGSIITRAGNLPDHLFLNRCFAEIRETFNHIMSLITGYNIS